jgi:hypothetical protein
MKRSKGNGFQEIQAYMAQFYEVEEVYINFY